MGIKERGRLSEIKINPPQCTKCSQQEVFTLMQKHDFQGYVSLEFEGQTDPPEANTKSFVVASRNFWYDT